MITYLVFIFWISSAISNPVQQQPLRSPLVYYTPSSSQYVSNTPLYPFVQYPGVAPPFGKALQSIQSPNEVLFYPNTAPAQPVVVNTQPGNLPVNRFTAPPDGLVDAIYAWFSENNVPGRDETRINEATPERAESSKDQEKTEKPAGEAEVLAEAERNPNLHYPKKATTPNFKPGQRFYILNGQPQFFGNYQPVLPRVQPVIPQLLTRSTIPADTQNILFLQQPELQQPNLKLKNPGFATQEPSGQNVVLLRNNLGAEQVSNVQPEVKPVRYHGQDLKPQNYVLLREASQGETPTQDVSNQQIVQNYQQPQYVYGRFLPQVNEQLLQQQVAQTPIHQTQYVPVGVVPPQIPVHASNVYQNDNQEQETGAQQLSFIHIPIDRNVQPPQYIKSIVPISINARAQVPELQNQEQRNAGKQILYLSPVAQQPGNVENLEPVVASDNQNQQETNVQEQQQSNNDEAPGIPALEFARYIASRHGELYSDSVVVEAKTEDENKEESDNESEDEVQADMPQEPSLAQAQPGGIALAGPGGVASTAPRATALVGDKGLAVASPQATAVAGTKTDKAEEKPKRT